MDNQQLLQELEEKFSAMKQEIGFSASFSELDDTFFISDAILRDKFVSKRLSRQVCHRIVELFSSWNEYLHSLIMPNPQNMLNMSESKLFNAQEKKEIMELMKQSMEISSRNSVLGLQKAQEGQFIDDALALWNHTFKDKLTQIMKKVNQGWAGK